MRCSNSQREIGSAPSLYSSCSHGHVNSGWQTAPFLENVESLCKPGGRKIASLEAPVHVHDQELYILFIE